MGKKNVTIALEEGEYKVLEKIKKQTKTKSFTQTIVKLIHFYTTNVELIDQIHSEEQSALEKIDDLEKELSIIKKNMVDQEQIKYINTNVDFIKQNYDIVQSLVKRLDNLQDSFLSKEDINLLTTKLESNENSVESVKSRTEFMEKILEKMFGIPVNKLIDAPTHILEQLYAQALDKK